MIERVLLETGDSIPLILLDANEPGPKPIDIRLPLVVWLLCMAFAAFVAWMGA